MTLIRKSALILALIGLCCVSASPTGMKDDDIPDARQFFRQIFDGFGERMKKGFPNYDLKSIDPLHLRDVMAFMDWDHIDDYLDFYLKGTLTGESSNYTVLYYNTYYQYSPEGNEFVVGVKTNATDLTFTGTYKLTGYVNGAEVKDVTGDITLTCDYTTRHLVASSLVYGTPITDPYPFALNGMQSDTPICGNPNLEITGLPDDVQTFVDEHHKKFAYEMFDAIDQQFHSSEYDLLYYDIEISQQNFTSSESQRRT